MAKQVVPSFWTCGSQFYRWFCSCILQKSVKVVSQIHQKLRRKQTKLVKLIKILPSEECITQHKTLIYEFKIRKVKSTRRKIRKLHEDSLKSNFSSYINQYRATSQKDTSVEDYWNVLKVALVEATDRSCGWTKVQLHIKKHGGGVMMLVIVLLRSGSACNEKYLDSRKKASRTVYQSKCNAERKR